MEEKLESLLRFFLRSQGNPCSAEINTIPYPDPEISAESTVFQGSHKSEKKPGPSWWQNEQLLFRDAEVFPGSHARAKSQKA